MPTFTCFDDNKNKTNRAIQTSDVVGIDNKIKDTVGTMIVDSSTVDLSYNSTSKTLKAEVIGSVIKTAKFSLTAQQIMALNGLANDVILSDILPSLPTYGQAYRLLNFRAHLLGNSDGISSFTGFGFGLLCGSNYLIGSFALDSIKSTHYNSWASLVIGSSSFIGTNNIYLLAHNNSNFTQNGTDAQGIDFYIDYYIINP